MHNVEKLTQQALFKLPSFSTEVHSGVGRLRAAFHLLPSVWDVIPIISEWLAAEAPISRLLSECEEIWIKPNITSAESPERGRTTQPAVLESLLRVILDIRPNAPVFVADSSVIGCPTTYAATISGILESCRRHGVKFIDLRDKPFRRVPVDGPRVFSELQVSEPFLSDGVLKINLAKIKSTYGSPVAFCTKNAKGCIPDELKLAFHLKGLQQSLCDLATCITWNLSILEGFPCSELGRPGPGGYFVISTHPVLADVLGCLALKVPLDDAEHIRLLSQHFGVDVNHLQRSPGFEEVIQSCHSLKYSKTAIQDLEEEYGININDGRPCTGCLESAAKALKRSSGEVKKAQLELYMGADVSKSIRPQTDAQTRRVLLGNCSFDRFGIEFERQCYPDHLIELWQRGIKVPGCPPTIDTMVTSLAPQTAGGVSASSASVSQRIIDAFEIRPIQALATSSQISGVLSALPPEVVSFDTLGREAALAGELICAAICHQINWDYLRRTVRRALAKGDRWWRLPNLAAINATAVEQLLAGYDKPERVRASQRAQMLRSLSKLTQTASSYEEAFPTPLTSPEECSLFLSQLEGCEVFQEDIERKKLQVLLHQLARTKLVEGIGGLCRPAVDYHIMRLYLRRGEVAPRSGIGSEYMFVEKNRRSQTVTALRRTVAEAVDRIAGFSGKPIHAVNSAEWWIGRSVCRRSEPDCHLRGAAAEWLRPRYQRCPYAGNCVALNVDNALLTVKEPKHIGRLY